MAGIYLSLSPLGHAYLLIKPLNTCNMMPYSKVAVESYVLLPLFHSREELAHKLLSKGTWSSRRSPVKEHKSGKGSRKSAEISRRKGIVCKRRGPLAGLAAPNTDSSDDKPQEARRLGICTKHKSKLRIGSQIATGNRAAMPA